MFLIKKTNVELNFVTQVVICELNFEQRLYDLHRSFRQYL